MSVGLMHVLSILLRLLFSFDILRASQLRKDLTGKEVIDPLGILASDLYIRCCGRQFIEKLLYCL